ncbi:hypothetical protein, partial [Mycolicibacterium insubricum]|uniref:hypothetical protein n=1 Tax=Mycolicibacterium insubricum TaxID=444597 RepID=UPI0021F2736B
MSFSLSESAAVTARVAVLMARNGGWRESGRNVLFAMALAAGMILAGGHPSAWADGGPGSDTKSRPQPTAQQRRGLRQLDQRRQRLHDGDVGV